MNRLLLPPKRTSSAMWVASPWGFSEIRIQPARHECHACCPLQAEKPGIQPIVGNTHGTHVEQVVSSFQKILRGSQLSWYMDGRSLEVLVRGRLGRRQRSAFDPLVSGDECRSPSNKISFIIANRIRKVITQSRPANFEWSHNIRKTPYSRWFSV